MHVIKLLPIIFMMLIWGCNNEDSSTSAPSGLTVTPGNFEITILTPANDGAMLVGASVISGHCGKPGYPVSITGPYSFYSVCQNDYSWYAAVDSNKVSNGASTFTVQLTDLNLSGGSTTVSRSFNKIASPCSDPANKTKLFANLSEADGINVPYIICTPEQFSNIRFYANKKFMLGDNVNYSYKTVSPVTVSFQGELDGQGFHLENFIVEDLGGDDVSVGLFSVVHNGTIRNIGFRNGLVKGYERVGLIAGDWRGTGVIDNVRVTGSVQSVTSSGGLIGLANTASALSISNLKANVNVKGNNYSGGLIGIILTNDGSLNISNSEIYADVSGLNSVGGLVGSLLEDNTILNNVHHKGSVTSLGINVGGLFGELAGGSLTNVSHEGSVSSSKDAVDVYLGGIIGLSKGPTDIFSSSVKSNLSSGGHYTGGIAGRLHSGTIKDTKSYGSIFVQDDYYNGVNKFVGGLVGVISTNSSVINSHSQMTITAHSHYVGGLVGNFLGDQSIIQDSYYKGTLFGRTSFIGGIAGNFVGKEISRTFSRTTISVDTPTPNAYIGGLVGYASNSALTIQQVYQNGDISITNGLADNVGGIAGYVKGLSLNKAYFNGAISGARSRVGGIAGYLLSPVTAAHSTGTIEASLRMIGGIAGISNNVSISDAFSTMVLSGAGEIGGIAGWMANSTASLGTSYFSGHITKIAGSTFSESTFGPVTGVIDTLALMTNTIASSSVTIINGADNTTLASSNTNYNLQLSSAQLQAQSSYSGYTFDSLNTLTWGMPTTGFKLPFATTEYYHAVPNWLLEANQGFQIPEVVDGTVALSQPVIFSESTVDASHYTQDELNIITSTSAPTTVTVGELQMSLLEPSADYSPIATKKLIYGECGIPGAVILVSGSFNLHTICQSNYRWTGLINSDGLPTGNLTLSIKMFSLDKLSATSTISRIIVKKSDACSTKEAIEGTFANMHLGADGSLASPYLVCHKGHFANINYYTDKHFLLANDVDFGGNTIAPMGAVFKGSLDGQGFKIKNFVIHQPNARGVALFGSVEGATIKNLTIENATVTGYDRVGVLAGTWRGSGTLSDIKVAGSVKGISSTGGLIGVANTSSDLTLTRITSTLNVQGNNYTGGLIGQFPMDGVDFSAQYVDITGSVKGLNYVGGMVGFTAEPTFLVQDVQVKTGSLIEGLGTHVGGITGHGFGGTYKNVNLKATLNAPKDAVDGFIGGVVGLDEGYLSLSSSIFDGSISSGMNYVGGMVGKAKQGDFQNLQSFGTITVIDDKYANSVRSFVGGLFGYIGSDQLTSTLNASSSTATLDTQAQMVGGLVGRMDGEGSIISNSYYKGYIKARTAFVGGIAGVFTGSTFHDSYSTANIDINNPTPNSYLGGLLGYANSKTASFRKLYATGSISITNGLADYVGGLIGFFRAGAITESYATGNITGSRNSSGGLIGILRGALSKSYATGTVTSSLRHNGGLVGYLANGSITDSFALGDVIAGEFSGGLVGYANSTSLAVKNTYAFGTVTRSATSTSALSTFGPVVGISSLTDTVESASAYYLQSKAQEGHTIFGTPVSDPNTSSSYPAFDFVTAGAWRMPSTGFSLPGAGTYTQPVLEWIDVNGSSSDPVYTISGTIQGLAYSDVQLTLNGTETISIATSSTNFTFATSLTAGTTYSVSLTKNPSSPDIVCELLNGSGTMGNMNVTNVEVICPTFQSIAITSTSSLATGTSLQMTVEGTLSNNVNIALENHATWTFDNPTSFTLSSTGLLTALADGSTLVTAAFLNLSASQSVTALTPPNAATNLSWQQTSPATVKDITAQWTPSTSTNLTSQTVRYFSQSACGGPVISYASLLPGVSSHTFTGEDNKTYSFDVVTTDSNSISTISTCSSDLLITLPSPSPVSNLAFSTPWVNGTSPVSSSLLSWLNPADIADVKVALGSNVGGAEIINWTSIGVMTSHTFSGLTLTECSPNFASVKTVNTYGKESSVTSESLGFRWDNTSPAVSGSLTASDAATESTSPTMNWTAATDNCAMRYYEMAIGTSSGGTEISGGWKAIGNVTSYKAQNGVGGFSISLTTGTDYYTSVRAVDYANNRSTLLVSLAWQVPSTVSRTLWFDGQSLADVTDENGVYADSAGFTGSVNTWENKESTALHFAAASPTAMPTYSPTLKELNFNGSSDLMILPSSTLVDNGTYTTRNIFVSFKTGANITNRQVIYEQGDGTRGMNLYIDTGKLYCGFWNTSQDGDGKQNFISLNTDVITGTIYHALLLLDYSNYTSSSGADGAFKCQVNTTMLGSVATTSRLFPHATGTGLGGANAGTRFHDTTTSSSGHYFYGKILEWQMLETLPTSSQISSVMEYLMAKWSSADIAAPGNFAIINNATASSSATASWTAISDPNFVTDHYLMALGTSPGGFDVVYWTNVGNVLTYQLQDGIDGVTLALATNTDYYLTLKAVDQYGIESQEVTSVAWRYVPSSGSLAGAFLKADSKIHDSITDDMGVLASQTGYNGKVVNWGDQLTLDGGQPFTAASSSAPTFSVSSNNGVLFGTNKYMTVANHTDINSSTTLKKSITIAFQTGTDVTNKQVLYDLGSRTKGMNIYIQGGVLYCGFWVTTDQGDGVQNFISVNSSVIANTKYVVTFVYDYTNYTSATGDNGKLTSYVNSAKIGEAATTSRYFGDTSLTGLGAQVDGGRYHDTNSNKQSDFYFTGSILEVTLTKEVPTATEIQQYHEGIKSKWGF